MSGQPRTNSRKIAGAENCICNGKNTRVITWLKIDLYALISIYSWAHFNVWFDKFLGKLFFKQFCSKTKTTVFQAILLRNRSKISNLEYEKNFKTWILKKNSNLEIKKTPSLEFTKKSSLGIRKKRLRKIIKPWIDKKMFMPWNYKNLLKSAWKKLICLDSNEIEYISPAHLMLIWEILR